MLDTFKIEPLDETVARSRVFFIEAVRLSKQEVERAEVRLEDALRTYDDADWEGGNVIRLAEDNLANAEAAHETNVARSFWESQRHFARQVTPTRPMVTPWLDSNAAWLAIFAHYKLIRPDNQL